MKQEIKAQWIEDLTSGRFAQGKGRLKANNKYCCLGVLICSVGDDIDQYVKLNKTDLNDDFLKYVGLTLDQQGSLIEMNDNGASFDYIAEWIKENL